MRRGRTRLATALALVLSLASSGCIGQFALTKDVYTRNQRVHDKVAREAIFFGLCIIPVYELALIADLLVLNTIELITDENPWAENRPYDSEP